MESYKITKVVIVNDYNEFYSEIYHIYNSIGNIEEDELDRFKNITLNKKEMSVEDNLKHLLYSIEETQDNEKVKYKLPGFYITRTYANSIIANLEEKHFHLITGHRISGKTYLILNLIDKIKDRDTYYIPSKYSLKISSVEKLINKNKVVVFLDSNSVGCEEIDYILERKHKLHENDIHFFVFVNSSDKLLISSIREYEWLCIDIELPNKLERKEVKEINEKLSFNSLPKFSYNSTILDNLYCYDSYCKEHYPNIYSKSSIPSTNVVFTECELIVFIMLAVNDKILLSEIKLFEIDIEISDILNKFSPIIQIDYTLKFEKNFSVGYKIISNAKYWILKALGDYAKIKRNREVIAKTIKKMVKVLRSEPRHFETSIQIMLFDTLNDIFPRKEGGVVGLIHEIYQELGEILHNDNQYLIQRAKSILNLNSEDVKELRNGILYADNAHRNLLNEKKDCGYKEKIKKIETVIEHAVFTKAMLYGRLINIEKYTNNTDIQNAIDNYFEAFSSKDNQTYVKGLIRKTFNNKDNTKADLKQLFINYSKSGAVNQQYDRKISFIFSIYRSYGLDR